MPSFKGEQLLTARKIMDTSNLLRANMVQKSVMYKEITVFIRLKAAAFI